MEAFSASGTVRLRFADGTSVLARGDGRGGLAMAAVAALQGQTVLLSHVADDGVTVRAVLTWPRRHDVHVEVLGEDQPG